MPGLTLEDLMTSVATYKAGATEGSSQLTSLFGKQAELEANNAAIFKQSAEDSSTVEAAKQAGILQTQARIAKTAATFGTDILAQNEQFTQLADTGRAAYAKKQELADVIAQKESVSIFDNPIEYLINKFTINSDITAHNAANAMLQNSQARIQELNSETQSTVQTQKMLETGVTVASAAAAARDAAVSANVNANKSLIQAAGYGVKGIEAVLTSSKAKLEADNLAFNGTNAAEHIRIAQANLALSAAAAAERVREFNIRQSDREDEKAVGMGMIATMNKGRQARGAPPLDDLNGKMVFRALTGKGGKISAEMQADMEAGARFEINGIKSVAGTPVELAQRINSGIDLGLTPAQQPIKSVVQQAINIVSAASKDPFSKEAMANPGLKGTDPKNKDQMIAAVNNTAQAIINSQAREIKPGDKDNMFQILSFNTIAQHSAVVQATPLYKKVFKPLMDQGVQLTDPKQIFNLVATAASKGTITHKEALDLTTFYHVGVGINRADRNLEGIAGLVFSNSYNAKVETNPFGLMTTDSIVNLTDPGQVSNALLKVQSAKLRVSMAEGGTSMLPKLNAATSKLTMPIINQDDLQFGPANTFITPARATAAKKSVGE
jgi:hypothetical protein